MLIGFMCLLLLVYDISKKAFTDLRSLIDSVVIRLDVTRLALTDCRERSILT